MRCFQLVPPNPFGEGGFTWWSLLIRPVELQVPGKTGGLDDSVSLDNDALRWIEPHLMALRKSRAEREPLWSFDCARLRGAFGEPARAEEVDSLLPTLYGLRHGGAIHDRITWRRSLMEVAKRGRWRASLSARRYEKHRRLALHVAKLPENGQTSLRAAEQDLLRLFGATLAGPVTAPKLEAGDARSLSATRLGWPPRSIKKESASCSCLLRGWCLGGELLGIIVAAAQSSRRRKPRSAAAATEAP